MNHTLESFSQAVHDLLAVDSGPQGREQVRRLLEQVLLLPAFSELLGDDQPQRRVLYADEQLGFSILGHVYHHAKRVAPHDHGDTWAIYGQVSGESIMDAWTIVAEPQGEQPGKVRLKHSYHLTPGVAHLYNEGVLHAPRREAAATLIRIEGGHVGNRRQWEIVD